jgi:hypothetical protein
MRRAASTPSNAARAQAVTEQLGNVLCSGRSLSLALLSPAIEVAADGPPHDELPVTLDDAVPCTTRVKLRLLHC